jgi:ribosomal protein S18 acetylase RimI-like enzyme
MSGETRPALADDVLRLWPAVKAAHLMRSAEEFAAFREASPWRVRVSDSGEAMMLARWRAHLDVLAIRGLWASPHRTVAFVDDAADVARAQGFERVLSPLVAENDFGPYADAGMSVVEPIVALQGLVASVAHRQPPPGVSLRRAEAEDLRELETLDAACFESFWRYGAFELAEALDRERVIVAERAEDAAVIGYLTSAAWGATVTVGRLAVAPDARHGGVGGALMGDAAAWARRLGAYSISLCTQQGNDESRVLYRSLGLSELPERFVLAARRA